jgi:hypothetical protein
MGCENLPSWTQSSRYRIPSPQITAADLSNMNSGLEFPGSVPKLPQIRGGNFFDIYQIVVEENGETTDREIYSPSPEEETSVMNEQLRLTDTLCLMVAENRNTPEKVNDVLLGGKEKDRAKIVEAMVTIMDRDYLNLDSNFAFSLMLEDWDRAIKQVDAQVEQTPQALPLPGLGLVDPIARDEFTQSAKVNQLRERMARAWFQRSLRIANGNKPSLYDPQKLSQLAPTMIVGFKPAHLSLSVQLGSVSYNPDDPDTLEVANLRLANRGSSEFEREAHTRWIQMQTFAAEQMVIACVQKGRPISQLNSRSNVKSANYVFADGRGHQPPQVIFVDRAFVADDYRLVETPYYFRDDQRTEFATWLTEFGLSLYTHRNAVDSRLREMKHIREQPWTMGYNN